MSYCYEKRVDDSNLQKGKITVCNIKWDIDKDDALATFDEMSIKRKAEYLGISVNKLKQLSEDDIAKKLDDKWYDVWTEEYDYSDIMGLPKDVLLPDRVAKDYRQQDYDDDVINDYLSDEYNWCMKNYDVFDYDKVYKETAKEVFVEFNGYENGHSSYMVADVDREAFTDFFVNLVLSEGFDKEQRGGIGELRFEENNGYTIAKFESCEKYPGLNSIIEEAFPNSITYGSGQWDAIGVEAPKNAYESSLDDCCNEGSGIRIDVEIKDKRTGGTLYIGDLIELDYDDIECVNTDGEFLEIEPDNETYQSLMSYLSDSEKFQVYQALDELRADLREDFEQEDEMEK